MDDKVRWNMTEAEFVRTAQELRKAPLPRRPVILGPELWRKLRNRDLIDEEGRPNKARRAELELELTLAGVI